MENDRTKGLMLAFVTFFMWGVFPIFFKLIKDVDAVQILAHRVVWSFVLLLVFLCFTHRLKNVARLLSTPKIALTLLCTGLLISTNWGIYIYAVNSDQILATSLGYFINPLFSVLLGALFLRERLSAAAKLSLLLAFAAIGVPIYALGRLPIISLVPPISPIITIRAISGSCSKRLRQSVKPMPRTISPPIPMIYFCPNPR